MRFGCCRDSIFCPAVSCPATGSGQSTVLSAFWLAQVCSGLQTAGVFPNEMSCIVPTHRSLPHTHRSLSKKMKQLAFNVWLCLRRNSEVVSNYNFSFLHVFRRKHAEKKRLQSGKQLQFYRCAGYGLEYRYKADAYTCV